MQVSLLAIAPHRQTETDRHRETERQRDRETERQTDTERQRDRETERQTDRQTDRETERQRDRETERKKRGYSMAVTSASGQVEVKHLKIPSFLFKMGMRQPPPKGWGFPCFNVSSSFLCLPFSALVVLLSLCVLTFSSPNMALPMRCEAYRYIHTYKYVCCRENPGQVWPILKLKSWPR